MRKMAQKWCIRNMQFGMDPRKNFGTKIYSQIYQGTLPPGPPPGEPAGSHGPLRARTSGARAPAALGVELSSTLRRGLRPFATPVHAAKLHTLQGLRPRTPAQLS